MIEMVVDIALAEVPVNAVPLIDDTDFKSIETTVAYNAAGMDLIWNFVTEAGAMTQTAVTPTTGGDYDWANGGLAKGMYVIEIPLSGGVSINNDTEGYGYFTGFATGILPWRGPTIWFRSTPNSNATQEQVNNIGSGATGGTHVEATYDNTTRDTIDNAGANLLGGGLVGIPVTGHTFVAGREITIAGSVAYNGAFDIVSQTANEVVITHAQTAEAFSGAETIVSSIKGEIFVGTITSGTFDDTSAAQGDLHSMDDDGNVIKIVYGYNVFGSREATDIAIFANVNGNTDEIIIKAYNFVTDAFEAKATLSGSGGTAFITLDPELVKRNTGTGTEIGDVFIFFDTVTTTPSSLDIDKCLVTAVGTNVLIGYPNGFEVSAAGTSGTEFGVNGTSGNPCPFADALTMNAITPLNLFTIQNGESVVLSGDSDNLTLQGVAWTLDLSDESIAGALFDGPHVTGIGTSAGDQAHFTNAKMGACTIPPSFLSKCGIGENSGILTAGSAGEYILDECYSMAPGSATPEFVFTGLGSATGVNNRGWKGGAKWTVDSDITMSHCVLVGGGTTIISSGADIELRGFMRSITLTLSAGGTTPTIQFVGITGPITISGTSAAGTTINLYGVSTSLTDTSVNTTVTDGTMSNTLLLDIPTVAEFEARTVGSTAATAMDLMYAAAITSGTVSDASATAADFDTDLTEASNNHYDDSAIVFTDGVLKGQVRPIDVSLGSASNGNITVSPVFTEAPGNGDAFQILGRQVEG